MSQATPLIGPNQVGLNYRLQDNDGKLALLSQHKGATAPIYAVAGTAWVDDAATPWLLKIYDGTDWIVIGAINPTTNTYSPYQGNAPLRYLNHAADSGAANAYVIAPSPPITAYTTGQIVTLKPANTNTGAATLAVSGLPAKSIKLPNGNDPSPSDISTTAVYFLMYDGTDFILLNPSLPSNVRVSTNDTTPGVLNGKLIAGSHVALTENSDGGNETLSVSVVTGTEGDVIGKLSTPNTYSAGQRGAIITLEDSPTVTLDFAAGNNFSLYPTQNFTLLNPINQVPGQSGIIVIRQDAVGGRLITYHSTFNFSGGGEPGLSTDPYVRDVISYFVVDINNVICSFLPKVF